MAVIRFYGGSPESYQVEFTAWVVVVRPERCAHCGAEQTYIFWGSYLRWVRFTTHRLHIRIERVRCTVCRVTDAILPSFLHIFRHYALLPHPASHYPGHRRRPVGRRPGQCCGAVQPASLLHRPRMGLVIRSQRRLATALAPEGVAGSRSPGIPRSRPSSEASARHPECPTSDCLPARLAGPATGASPLCYHPRPTAQPGLPGDYATGFPGGGPRCCWAHAPSALAQRRRPICHTAHPIRPPAAAGHESRPAALTNIVLSSQAGHLLVY